MESIADRPYFFDDGIRFACRQCGRCCTGDSGTVYVGGDEIVGIAEFLDLSRILLVQRYLYPFKDSYSIAEDDEGNCLFYENGCRIYPVRPGQCRAYPFWFHNLRSESRWRQVIKECPGIGTGPLYSKEQILDILRASFKTFQFDQDPPPT